MYVQYLQAVLQQQLGLFDQTRSSLIADGL